MNARSCYRCHIKKPLTPEFFWRDKSMPSGFKYICKKCGYKNDKERKFKNNRLVRDRFQHRIKRMLGGVKPKGLKIRCDCGKVVKTCVYDPEEMHLFLEIIKNTCILHAEAH